MASELTRYLRIHEKHPYGKRGERAILDLAARVERAAQNESKLVADLFREFAFVEGMLARVRKSLEGATLEGAPPSANQARADAADADQLFAAVSRAASAVRAMRPTADEPSR